jgi:hypothetical protein
MEGGGCAGSGSGMHFGTTPRVLRQGVEPRATGTVPFRRPEFAAAAKP